MAESGAGPTPGATADNPEPSAPRTAGALLKAARQREKLHLAVLAATIKVAPAKLEALEQDRYDQLPNPTFTRALAQSVCRSLKIDPRPVLALLPQVEMAALEGSVGRLNTPFHERPDRTDGGTLAWATKPMFWAGGLLLVAAVVVGLLPPDLASNWTGGLTGGDGVQVAVDTKRVAAPQGASSPVVAAAASPGPVVAPADTAPDVAAQAAGGVAAASAASAGAPSVTLANGVGQAGGATASPVATAGSAAAVPVPALATTPAAVAGPDQPAEPVGPGLLRLTASADTWIEVIDAGGQAAFSRVLQRGESVSVNPRPPLRVKVGNVAGTTMAFRGKAFDLGPFTRDNVARVELR